MKKTGIIYFKIKCFLELDVTEDQAQDIINELDYTIEHPLIIESEIIESEV